MMHIACCQEHTPQGQKPPHFCVAERQPLLGGRRRGGSQAFKKWKPEGQEKQVVGVQIELIWLVLQQCVSQHFAPSLKISFIYTKQAEATPATSLPTGISRWRPIKVEPFKFKIPRPDRSSWKTEMKSAGHLPPFRQVLGKAITCDSSGSKFSQTFLCSKCS